jgi:hypothetical protein
MKQTIFFHTFILICATSIICYGQKQSFDLQRLLKENKLITNNKKVVPLADANKKAISLTGVVWVKDASFSTGTIEVDLRGKDVMQQSFLGIAFHGVDTTTMDIVYFRPFNFRSADPVRKIHAVQYVSHPDFPWHKLREEKNGIYEKAVNPAPAATDWFHAKIEVGETEIKVYVNNNSTPSLTVEKLNARKDGLIGLWNEGLPGDFANLVITK